MTPKNVYLNRIKVATVAGQVNSLRRHLAYLLEKIATKHEGDLPYLCGLKPRELHQINVAQARLMVMEAMERMVIERYNRSFRLARRSPPGTSVPIPPELGGD